MNAALVFIECDTCRAKPGSPYLCAGCLNNRRVIEALTGRMTPGRIPIGSPALHASAPDGHKCADCTMDGEACPACYTAWWRNRHPHTTQIPPSCPDPYCQLDEGHEGDHDDTPKELPE